MTLTEWNKLTDENRRAIVKYWAKIIHPTFGPNAIADLVEEFSKKYKNKEEGRHGPINFTKITKSGTANITISFVVGLQLPIFNDSKNTKKCLK